MLFDVETAESGYQVCKDVVELTIKESKDLDDLIDKLRSRL